MGGTQNGQPKSGGDNSGGRRSTSAFDRLGPGNPDPRPFGGIGSNDTHIIQELRHHMQAMEVEVKGLRKENVKLKNATKDLRSRRRSPRRHRSRSKSKTPPRRRERTPPRERTPLANAPHLGGDVIQATRMITRKYIERFNTECKTIDGLVDGVASLCLTNGLANDDFRRQLTTKPVWTRKDMQTKAKDFIHHEEVNRVVAATKSQQTQTASRASITEVYQQISDKGILSRARPLQGRTLNAKNKTLFCDCYDLKNPIEQAIRERKLGEFIQVIREPRNIGRERSEGPETRNPRNLRDADKTMPIVPAITGANHTEKSKSAHKKDLKILATVRSAPPQLPAITFNNKYFEHGMADSDAPMLISAGVGPGIVRRILIDTGADSNIIF
ncbi:hypothetical protein PIB30_073626 [Stylosanthes scabra]|uniref:Peptidase A2 domain-containing protein n=1 Tax=Stylosanthes scabra TaxID=79078 RepID=A0ABU6VP64_9FABA|nr:hypothetical protein [Stylosanthes scabra]